MADKNEEVIDEKKLTEESVEFAAPILVLYLTRDIWLILDLSNQDIFVPSLLWLGSYVIE